jgi:hypothetical protein
VEVNTGNGESKEGSPIPAHSHCSTVADTQISGLFHVGKSLAHGTKFPLSDRIVAAQRFLNRTLDSFWTFLASLFSKRTPTESTPDKEPKASAATFVKSHKLLLEILGVPCALLTIAGFYLSYAPRVFVDASESVASFSPMGTVFYLSNEGTLPIHNVAVSCANLRIDGDNLQVLGPWEFTNVPPEARAEVLSPGHKMSLPYAPAFGFTAVNNFKGAQLTIIVRYRPDWVLWRKKEIFPFQAVRTVSGGWIWKSVAQ